MRSVLGLNRRNAHIERVNHRRSIDLAKDKYATKRSLLNAGVPVPSTLVAIGSSRAARAFDWNTLPDGWVMKPSRGSRGLGVLVVTSTDRTRGETVWNAGTHKHDRRSLVAAARSIVHGDSSDVDDDIVLVEPLLQSGGELGALSPLGLPDIRVICDRQDPLLAMMRLPTVASEGRGNLHQGGVGAAIDMASGEITDGWWNGERCVAHPDTGIGFVGLRLPFWTEILAMSARCGPALGLGYVGVDVVLDIDAGPLVLEVNAHPGLEIQNVNGRTLDLDAPPGLPRALPVVPAFV